MRRKKVSLTGQQRLSAALPRQQLIDRFGAALILEEYGKEDLKVIAQKNPAPLHHVAACVWNRIVQRRWHSVNPRQFASYFTEHDPAMYLAISQFLKIEVIRDIYYAKAWESRKMNSKLVAELLVAWVYQNDLLLADVNFRDPERPIPTQERISALQSHKGLGLLPVVLNNMQSEAERLGCEYLILTAGTRDEMKLFAKYGFSVENSEPGRQGVLLGGGIPMERKV
jgi:hypothetical protein